MSKVRPLKPSNKVIHQKPKPKIKIHSEDMDTDEISENYSFSLGNIEEKEDIDSETYLCWATSSINTKIILKLKRGKFPIEALLDLHGLSAESAYEAILQFIDRSVKTNKRVALIIHGKRSLKPTEKPKLKNLTYHLLQNHPNVLAFCSAVPKDGGVGAVYVLLKKES